MVIVIGNADKQVKNIKNVAFIGNYLPRQCGIATFMTDLCESFASNNPSVQCLAIPITDIEEGYQYPERVRFEIEEQDLDTYKAAADFLNLNDIDIVCLQFEYLDVSPFSPFRHFLRNLN